MASKPPTEEDRVQVTKSLDDKIGAPLVRISIIDRDIKAINSLAFST